MTERKPRTDPGTYAIRMGPVLRAELERRAAALGIRPAELARQLVADGMARVRLADGLAHLLAAPPAPKERDA